MAGRGASSNEAKTKTITAKAEPRVAGEPLMAQGGLTCLQPKYMVKLLRKKDICPWATWKSNKNQKSKSHVLVKGRQTIWHYGKHSGQGPWHDSHQRLLQNEMAWSHLRSSNPCEHLGLIGKDIRMLSSKQKQKRNPMIVLGNQTITQHADSKATWATHIQCKLSASGPFCHESLAETLVSATVVSTIWSTRNHLSAGKLIARPSTNQSFLWNALGCWESWVFGNLCVSSRWNYLFLSFLKKWGKHLFTKKAGKSRELQLKESMGFADASKCLLSICKHEAVVVDQKQLYQLPKKQWKQCDSQTWSCRHPSKGLDCVQQNQKGEFKRRIDSWKRMEQLT